MLRQSRTNTIPAVNKNNKEADYEKNDNYIILYSVFGCLSL